MNEIFARIELGSFDYRYPDGSGGKLRIHGYTQDMEIVFITFEGGQFDARNVSWFYCEKITLTRIIE